MSPQARAKLPPELGRLTRKDMEAVIYQANLGRENEKIAQLYFVDKLPQVDVATEMFLRVSVSGFGNREQESFIRWYSKTMLFPGE